MGDEPVPLSWEETNSLYTKASVSFIAVFFVFLAYFEYLMNYYSPMSLFGLLTKLGLPFSVAELFAWHISVEVLYHSRVKKSLRFHLRRFAVNSSFFFAVTLSGLGVMIAVNVVLSSQIGAFQSIMLGSVLWMLVLVIIALRFRNTWRRHWKAP